MEIKVKVDATELVTALIALADVLEEVNKRLSNKPLTVEPMVVVEQADTTTAKQTEDEPKEKQMTVVELRAEINKMIEAGEIANVDVRNKLDGFGVKKLTDLDAKHYGDLLKGLVKK